MSEEVLAAFERDGPHPVFTVHKKLGDGRWWHVRKADSHVIYPMVSEDQARLWCDRLNEAVSIGRSQK